MLGARVFLQCAPLLASLLDASKESEIHIIQIVKNIVYFSPKINSPIGGVKVIHRHSEIIGELGGNSEIYYMYGGAEHVNWFPHRAKIKIGGVFDPAVDFVILPESQIFNYWKLLNNINIQYGIFVQNGYLVHKGIDIKDMAACYDAAKLIICISEDAVRCIFKFFPEYAQKVVRVSCSIDDAKFASSEKKNVITYMPRKLREHSSLLVSMLSLRIPSHWQIVPIDNVNEGQVANILSTSRVFMSFGDMEGLGLPPLEAAFCGNFVIGYSGQGGNEYWSPPIFERIESGDIVCFLDRVLSKIHEIDSWKLAISEGSLISLRNQFSRDTERRLIKNLLTVIESL